MVPEVRQKAIALLATHQAQDEGQLAHAIRAFVREHMVIVNEAEELLHTPLRQLREIALHGRVFGDCDDASLLSASLLAVLGIPARFAAIRLSGQTRYRHVFVEYHAGGRWRRLDATQDLLSLPAGTEFLRVHV